MRKYIFPVLCLVLIPFTIGIGLDCIRRDTGTPLQVVLNIGCEVFVAIASWPKNKSTHHIK